MKNDKKLLEIQLLDRCLHVKSPPDKAEDLQKAAYYLDSKMREVRNQGVATGHERIALLAALNIAYELITAHKQKDIYLESVSNRVRELQNRIDEILAPENQDMF